MCIRDRSVAIVDCDSTQRSLFNLRERDMEMVEINKKYMVLLEEQRLRGCRIYPIRQAKPCPVSYTHLWSWSCAPPCQASINGLR